jgi:hypothetical protein
MGTPQLAVLSPEQVADILQKIAEIQAILPEGVALRPSDRQKLLKLGRKTTQFVQRTIEITQQNPDMVPVYIDRPSMETSYHIYNQMLTIIASVEQLERKVTDIMLVSGNIANTSSISCYHAIKNASKDNVPGAQPVYDALKIRFKPVKRKTGPVEPGANAEVAFS